MINVSWALTHITIAKCPWMLTRSPTCMVGPLVLYLAAVLRLVLVLARTRAQKGTDGHPVARFAGFDLLTHYIPR